MMPIPILSLPSHVSYFVRTFYYNIDLKEMQIFVNFWGVSKKFTKICTSDCRIERNEKMQDFEENCKFLQSLIEKLKSLGDSL